MLNLSPAGSGAGATAAVFGVSTLLTGTAGALAALSIGYVGPGMFGIFLSFGLLIGIAVGGIATLSGAIYGAIFLQFIFVVVGAGAQALQTWNITLLYGLVLVVFLAFNPRGVAGLIDRTWVSMRRRFGA